MDLQQVGPYGPDSIKEINHRLTIEDQLRGEKTHLEQWLADIDAALEALEANPEVLRVMNLVSKAQCGGYR